MTDAEREIQIRQTYRGLQGDMPPFGDVLTLLRLLDEARDLAAAPPQAPPGGPTMERAADIYNRLRSSAGPITIIAHAIEQVEREAQNSADFWMQAQAETAAERDQARAAELPSNGHSISSRIRALATAPPQAPPGLAMERSRKVLAKFHSWLRYCIDESQYRSIVDEYGAAIAQATEAERQRCLHWAAGSAHTAEYVVNAIECGAPPLATVGEP